MGAGEREFEGKDLDEAIAAASAALDMPASEIPWEMIEEGRRGVFGLGARMVRIRVAEVLEEIPGPSTPTSMSAAASSPTIMSAPMPKPTAKLASKSERDGPAPALSVPREPARAPSSAGAAPSGLVETVDRILDLMGFRASAEAIAHDGGWTIQVGGPDRKQLVKRDGEILDALEFLLNRMGRRAWPEAGSIRLGCAGFRDHRDEEIVALTREAASAVARSGQPEILQEMNPYERRLVHLTAREFPGVVSHSDGDGFLKRVRLEKAAD